MSSLTFGYVDSFENRTSVLLQYWKKRDDDHESGLTAPGKAVT